MPASSSSPLPRFPRGHIEKEGPLARARSAQFPRVIGSATKMLSIHHLLYWADFLVFLPGGRPRDWEERAQNQKAKNVLSLLSTSGRSHLPTLDVAILAKKHYWVSGQDATQEMVGWLVLLLYFGWVRFRTYSWNSAG